MHLKGEGYLLNGKCDAQIIGMENMTPTEILWQTIQIVIKNHNPGPFVWLIPLSLW